MFFRDSCRTEARRLGVSGWVRNVPDGTVEAVFEGSGDAVERMVSWCRQGPRGAVVTDVAVADEAPESLTSFSVR